MKLLNSMIQDYIPSFGSCTDVIITYKYIFGLLFLILFIVNQMRIFYTSDTLLLTDFLFLQTTGELANFVDVTFVNAINYILSPTIIVVAIFSWLLIISYKNNMYLSIAY